MCGAVVTPDQPHGQRVSLEERTITPCDLRKEAGLSALCVWECHLLFCLWFFIARWVRDTGCAAYLPVDVSVPRSPPVLSGSGAATDDWMGGPWLGDGARPAGLVLCVRLLPGGPVREGRRQRVSCLSAAHPEADLLQADLLQLCRCGSKAGDHLESFFVRCTQCGGLGVLSL